jgi:hypothetical protein
VEWEVCQEAWEAWEVSQDSPGVSQDKVVNQDKQEQQTQLLMKLIENLIVNAVCYIKYYSIPNFKYIIPLIHHY